MADRIKVGDRVFHETGNYRGVVVDKPERGKALVELDRPLMPAMPVVLLKIRELEPDDD